MPKNPFHLAFAVSDIETTRVFYSGTLGCKIGRESPGKWIDFDLFGHQITAHKRPAEIAQTNYSIVDGDDVPIPHFGVVLFMDEFEILSQKLMTDPSTRWVIKPKHRFVGEVGEQATMFVLDPSGNALEFKGFADHSKLFAS